MTQLTQILTPGRSLVNVPAGSKKKVLEYIVQLLASDCDGLDENSLLDSLIARERLGSTGFGNGIAIPHCRFGGCSEPVGALLRLHSPIDFDAIDSEPVDLVFVLLVPETATEDHLGLLRQIAFIFDQPQLRVQLRQAQDNQALYQTFLAGQPTIEEGEH